MLPQEITSETMREVPANMRQEAILKRQRWLKLIRKRERKFQHNSLRSIYRKVFGWHESLSLWRLQLIIDRYTRFVYIIYVTKHGISECYSTCDYNYSYIKKADSR